MARKRTRADAATMQATLEELRELAERARAEDLEEAERDLEALRALLPLPRSGPKRADAAAILARLDERRALDALDAASVEVLVAKRKLRISASTIRRLVREHEDRPIDGTKLRELAELEKEIRDQLAAGEAAAVAVGLLYNQVVTTRLYRFSPERTLTAWADARFPRYGHRTLQRYGRLVKAFTKETILRYGTAKLDLALRYLALTPEDDRPAELPRLQIPVPGKGLIPFPDISLADLDAAVKALTAAVSNPRPAKLPRGASAVATRLHHALAATPVPEGHPKPTVTTRLTRIGRQTVVLFTLHNLPQHLANRLSRATAGGS